MKVKFAIQLTVLPTVLSREDANGLMEYVRMADSYGIHTIGMGDSCFRLGESSTRITTMALATRNCYVGMRPTNPWTRDPQVMAAFLANIDSLSGGHAFMEIATGDSAVASIGRKAATRARLEEYLLCVRNLLANGEGTFEGRPERVMGAPRGPVTLSVTAEGPKMLHLAGRIGDAVSMGMGLTPEIIAASTEMVAAGAREAGRDPAEVNLWHTTRTELSEDREASVAKLSASLGSMLHHSMRSGVEGRFVPEELQPRVREFVDRYYLDDHQSVGGANDKLLNSSGLADYAYSRWGIAGNAKDWIERIDEIAAGGATQLWLLNRGRMDELLVKLRYFGEKILPHFA
jgi:5,10-methylenetetrahydromethanopterin reductase